MINKENITLEYPKLDQSQLPEKLQKSEYEFIAENIDLYHDDTDIKAYIDRFIEKLNQVQAQKPMIKAKTKKQPTTRKNLQSKLNKIKNDQLPQNHPLMVLDKSSPQFEKALDEYLVEKNKKVKNRKAKYKEGQQLFWYDTDGSLVNERIKEISFKTNGEPIYTVHGRQSWQYSQSEIEEALRDGTMNLDKAPAKMIEKIEPEIIFIKRFVNFHGKTVSSSQVLNLLRSIQKAITERTIRKTSIYSSEIETIQKSLVKTINTMGNSIKIEIDEKNLEQYKTIAGSQKTMPCVQYVKRFLSIQGKEGVTDKAKKLLSDIKKAKINPSDAIKNKIAEIKQSLENYITGKSNVPMVSISTLNGLMGLPGCHCKSKAIKDGEIINSMELAGMSFPTLTLTGKYQKLLGNPEIPFNCMIYGGPGSYKSTLAIQLSYYFAANHNKKVLYVGYEEKVGHTMREKFERLKAFHHNVSTVGHLPNNLSGFDMVIIDSVNSHRLSPDELRKMYKKHPQISFISVFQQTKDGNYRGSSEFEHDNDVVIHCENGIARPEKNRFGGKESINIL